MIFSSIMAILFVGLVTAGSYGILTVKNRHRNTAQAPLSSAAGRTGSSSGSVPLQTTEVPVLGLTDGGATSRSQPAASPPSPYPDGPSLDQLKGYEELRNNATASFIDIVVGEGQEVRENTKVAVLYKGWLTNGTLFDSSRKDAGGIVQPFIFTIGAREVVPGFEQGAFGMKVGGKRRVVIPPALGYGAAGQGPIPPDAVLVFDIELVDALGG